MTGRALNVHPSSWQYTMVWWMFGAGRAKFCFENERHVSMNENYLLSSSFSLPSRCTIPFGNSTFFSKTASREGSSNRLASLRRSGPQRPVASVGKWRYNSRGGRGLLCFEASVPSNGRAREQTPWISRVCSKYRWRRKRTLRKTVRRWRYAIFASGWFRCSNLLVSFSNTRAGSGIQHDQHGPTDLSGGEQFLQAYVQKWSVFSVSLLLFF